MQSRYYHIPERPKKSLAQETKEMAIFAVIMVGILCALQWLVGLIGKPFLCLFDGERKKFERRINKESDKIFEREALRKSYENSSSNPLYQYMQRFVLNARQYKGDVDNKEYKEWFKCFKAGNIIDSNLHWAPDVYKTYGDESVEISLEFLTYLDRQVVLHENGSAEERKIFMATLRNYYPEFESNFKNLQDEIAEYRITVKEKEAHEEFVLVMDDNGIPRSIAEELKKETHNSKTLKLRISIAKEWLDAGYGIKTASFGARNNYAPGDELAPVIDKMITVFNSEIAALSLIRGDLSIEQVSEFLKGFNAVGWSTKDEYDRIFDTQFRSFLKIKTCYTTRRKVA